MSALDVFAMIAFIWLLCVLISVMIYVNEEDVGDDVNWSVIWLFPANLIYILKTFWKAIVRAIKS